MEVEIKGIKGTVITMLSCKKSFSTLRTYNIDLETEDHTIISFRNVRSTEIKTIEN